MWIEDAKFWIMMSILAILVAIGVYVEKNPTLRMKAPSSQGISQEAPAQ